MQIELFLIIFDTVNFYPSITSDLLNKAIDFAREYVNRTEDEREIIMHAKRSYLIHNGENWSKKSTDKFDVTMGSFDGAETCELVGLFLPHNIRKQINGDFGLY